MRSYDFLQHDGPPPESRRARRRLLRQFIRRGPAVTLTITVANVLPGTGATTAQGTAGATITAGEALYRDAVTGKLFPAQASSTQTAAQAAVIGIAAEGALTGQPVIYYRSGQVKIGATVAVGTIYNLAADTAGGIAPSSDTTSTNWVSVIGVADTTTTLKLNFNNTGIVHA